MPMFFGFTIFVQIISVNQDSKLKKTVKKRAISLINRFVFSISRKNFWFQRDISLFCDFSGILEGGTLKIYRRWNVWMACKAGTK